MMSKTYQQVVASLDALSAPELVALLGEISIRLQAQVGTPIEDEAVDAAEPRRYLPRLPQMIEWGLVLPMEDTLYVNGAPEHPALLLDASRVAYQGQTMSLNDWAKAVTGWKAVNVYEWVLVKRQGRTLDDLRRTYLSENGQG